MPRKLITLYEHQSIGYEQIFPDPGSRQIQDRTLLQIEKINSAAGHNLLTLGRYRLSAGSWVGFLNTGDISFQILPKIDYWSGGENENQHSVVHSDQLAKNQLSEKSAMENLLYMIAYAYAIPIDKLKISFLQEQETTWFDLLAIFLSDQLSEQLPAGLAQEYITREEKSSTLRGRWDIQRQLKTSPPNLHQFHLIFDQYTHDIPINQVFRFVLDRLLILVRNGEMKNQLERIQSYFTNVSLPESISPEFLNTINFNRLNERYFTAFSLARIFLTGEFVTPFPGSNQSPAFALNMPVLFERFIAGFLKTHQEEIFAQFSPGLNIISQSEGKTIYLASERGRNTIRLQPDLLFTTQDGSKTLLIADTKYKQISQGEKGILSEDIYQVITYAIRMNCKRLSLIYPQAAKSKPMRNILEIPSIGTTLAINTVNLHQPLRNKEGLISELREIISNAITE